MDPNTNTSPEAANGAAPGSLIMPGGTGSETPVPTPSPTPVATSPVTPTVVEAPSAPGSTDQPEVSDEAPDTTPVFSWQASEYIHHDKGFGWYAVLVLAFVGLLAIAYFTHQWLSIGVFVMMAIAIVVYARKAPRTLTYELSQSGLTIEGKHYPFSHFRTFAVLPDLSWHTIDLEPTQRFMPRLTILFESTDFEGIVDHLAAYLPRVDRQPDLVERATRYLRF